jgi:hypothetical protein
VVSATGWAGTSDFTGILGCVKKQQQLEFPSWPYLLWLRREYLMKNGDGRRCGRTPLERSVHEPVNEIVLMQCLSPEIKLYKVKSPLIAKKRKAGQFVVVRLDERGERIPLTIADSDPQGGTITLVVQEVGATTRRMGMLREGDQ